ETKMSAYYEQNETYFWNGIIWMIESRLRLDGLSSDENKRNQKRIKRGRKHLFNKPVYQQRFSSERTFAWIAKFRALRVSDDIKDANFLGGHHLVFALINMRHLFSY
ncbi:MAG: hypothetical protein ACPG7F_04440, partial [Aggregatilineales bacterium]